MTIAKIECKKIGVNIISLGISDKISNYLDDDLFTIYKNNEGSIESIDYNTRVVNELLGEVAKISTNNFDDVKKNKKGIVKYLPMGIVTNNIFLENVGPKIPIKLLLDGNILTSLKTDVKEYGVDSALIKISIKIEANVKIVIPFESEDINIINEIPISIKIIKGNVSNILTSK